VNVTLKISLIAIVIAVAPAGIAAAAGPSKPAVEVIDGNTLIVGASRHTLYGIKAPSLGETCMVRGAMRDCGLIARSSMLDLTAGATVVCDRAPGAAASRSRCRANGYDLSEGMVHTGWARALADGPRRFKRIMAEAKDRKRGMWRRQ